MNAYQTLVKALQTATNIPALTLTCTGREGFGNQVARLHYERQHLVVKMSLRNDFKDGERELYMGHFLEEQQYPWTMLHEVEGFKLHTLEGELDIVPTNHLTSSVMSSHLLLTAMDTIDWDKVMVRQWKADNGGVGIELVAVVDDEIHEISVNYYAKPAIEAITESLNKAGKPLPEVTIA